MIFCACACYDFFNKFAVMKRITVILLAILTLAGCSGGKSLKVTQPEERAALRTRDASCPIDSVFTSASLETTFNIAGRIKPKALISDFKEAQSLSQETKETAKIKESYRKVKEEHSSDYSPALTIYMTIMLLVLIVIIVAKTARALFKNN